MYNIFVRRACESDYGVIAEKGKVLKFNTEDEARDYFYEHINGKSKLIISFYISKSSL